MANKDCYGEIRGLIIERCRDKTDRITVPSKNGGDARKALQSALRIIGEKSGVVDRVFTDLWRVEHLLTVEDGYLVVNERLMKQNLDKCRADHPVNGRSQPLAATA
ncbi:MAG: hypothetical protein V4678_03360 [Patescibacteria group bacterium]